MARKIHLLGLAAAAALATSAQAHPDLTGVWQSPFRVSAGGGPIMAGQTQWIPVSQGDPLQIKLPSIEDLVKQADKIPVGGGAGGPGGAPIRIGADPHQITAGPPPFTAAGRAAKAKLDPDALMRRRVACYPENIFLRLPGSPVQIVQNEKAIAMTSEFTPAGRVIFMDGRSQADAIPQWNGLSVGHWQGDTLVIDTVAIRGNLFGFDNPMSDEAKIHEEYHLSSDHKQLIGVATFTDPVYYTEPMRKAVYLDYKPGLQVLDYQCDEGKDDMIETRTAQR